MVRSYSTIQFSIDGKREFHRVKALFVRAVGVDLTDEQFIMVLLKAKVNIEELVLLSQ